MLLKNVSKQCSNQILHSLYKRNHGVSICSPLSFVNFFMENFEKKLLKKITNLSTCNVIWTILLLFVYMEAKLYPTFLNTLTTSIQILHSPQRKRNKEGRLCQIFLSTERHLANQATTYRYRKPSYTNKYLNVSPLVTKVFGYNDDNKQSNNAC